MKHIATFGTEQLFRDEDNRIIAVTIGLYANNTFAYESLQEYLTLKKLPSKNKAWRCEEWCD